MIFLQAQPGTNPIMSQVFLMVGIMVIFFFFMIWPQMRRQKKEKQFRENLKKGDRIVTISGVHGKVHSLDDDGTALVEIDENVKIRLEKSAIARYVGQKEEK
jgi:preprotein translocase subunit YajC